MIKVAEGKIVTENSLSMVEYNCPECGTHCSFDPDMIEPRKILSYGSNHTMMGSCTGRKPFIVYWVEPRKPQPENKGGTFDPLVARYPETFSYLPDLLVTPRMHKHLISHPSFLTLGDEGWDSRNAIELDRYKAGLR